MKANLIEISRLPRLARPVGHVIFAASQGDCAVLIMQAHDANLRSAGPREKNAPRAHPPGRLMIMMMMPLLLGGKNDNDFNFASVLFAPLVPRSRPITHVSSPYLFPVSLVTLL